MLPLAATAFAADKAGTQMRPRDTVGQFIAALDGDGDSEASAFRRAFAKRSSFRLRSAKVVSERDGVRLITVADADPNFARWQRDADERLKQESASITPKQHPFAAAHPTKSVVVCEAGCGASTKDEIVYLEAIVPAVLSTPKGQFEPNSSIRMDPAAAGLQDGELPCIAGCYRNSHHELSLKIDGDKQGRVDEQGATGERSIMLERSNAAPRTAPAQKGASADKRLGDGTVFTLTAPDFYDGWRTKIEFTGKRRASLAPRAWGRLSILTSEDLEDDRR